MIESLVETILLGACYELRARPEEPWVVKADWNRALALAVIEYHKERQRKLVRLSMIVGPGYLLGAFAIMAGIVRKRAA